MAAVTLRLALVGDRDDAKTAHQANPLALALAAAELGLAVDARWIGSDALPATDAATAALLAGFDALWCPPGSPYRDADGVLRAIRAAREGGLPFLGTCSGFQHAALEYARTVLGWADAGHAESTPDAARPVVAPLACALVEQREPLRLAAGSRLAGAYGVVETVEGYRCRYGLNPRYADALLAGPLRASAFSPDGEVRAIELDGHPFFVGTLFQPERAALDGATPPLVRALLVAAAARRRLSQTSGAATCC